jgi:hypothetical protein
MGGGKKNAGRVAGRRGWAKAARSTGIAVVADELEWRALAEQNPLFAAKDYPSYLFSVERRMRAAARAGRQVLVGPLLPDQFESRADEAGLARDSPRALREYELFVAELGPLTQPWLGEPMARVLERIRAHVRAETLQEKAMPTLAASAALHADADVAAQRAMSKASHLFLALIEDGGDGRHELRVTIQAPDGELDYTLPYARFAQVLSFPDDGGENMVVILLSIAILAGLPGTILLRSRSQASIFPTRRKPKGWRPDSRKPGPDGGRDDAEAGGEGWENHESVLRGWLLTKDLPEPMSEGRLFALACTGPDGDPIPPEPGTRFRAGFPLDPGRFRCCD